MIFPKSREGALDDALFQNPTAEYRGLPFWSWNCKLSKRTVREQLDVFREMGFGGVVIHPRDGLDTAYLGDEFMEIVRYTVSTCRELGLICWLYDDDRFPSGAADGLVTGDPHFRARTLRLTTAPLGDGYLPSRAAFEAALEGGDIPRGYALTAYAIRIEDGRLCAYRRLNAGAEAKDALRRGETVRYAYVELEEESAFFNGCTYVDTMNPAAVDRFIQVTHERYRSALGPDFGTTAAAIFTDEPRIGKQQPITAADSDEDVYLPYSESFADWCARERGFDPLDIAPEFIWDRADGDMRGRRAYHEATEACFSQAFMDKIADWCKKNGILMTGHILGESPLGSQTTTVGEAMRCYRDMDVPGVDMLIDAREFTGVKQAASVAAQYGREAVMSEEYGVTNWDCTFKTYKLQGDWQAALGITIRVPHLSHMSLKGEAKRDWPGSIFYQAPWYREFSQIEDHFARLHTVLTRGERVTRVAVIHPVESLWVCSGPDDRTRQRRARMDARFVRFAEWLLLGGVDFDYLSEVLLAEQGPAVAGRTLVVGRRAYEAVVVPECVTIRGTTLDMLRRFAESGGTVLFAGELPALVDGKPSREAAAFAEGQARVPMERDALLGALAGLRDVEYDGGNLLYQLRREEGCNWLFLCHAYPSNGARETHTVRLRGAYAVTAYDTMRGTRFPLSARTENGTTIFLWTCYGEDSLLLRLDPSACAGKAGGADAAEAEYETAQTLRRIDRYRRAEPNALLLDSARFSVDGGEIGEKTALIRADNLVRAVLGFPPHTGMDRQPYAVEDREPHTVTLYIDVQSEIETRAHLGIEDPERCRIVLNGEAACPTPDGWFVDKAIRTVTLPPIRKGTNALTVEMQYTRKSYLENLYLLGDFGVRGMTLTAPETALRYGDICAQGMPFYTGNLDYCFDVDVKEGGAYAVRVPSFSAPAIAVYADGERRGLIAYAPHRASLGDLCPGRHEIRLTLYGNRFNAFGMLHNADPNYVWYGNGSYRTTGDQWTDGYMLRPVGILSPVELERRKG